MDDNLRRACIFAVDTKFFSAIDADSLQAGYRTLLTAYDENGRCHEKIRTCGQLDYSLAFICRFVSASPWPISAICMCQHGVYLRSWVPDRRNEGKIGAWHCPDPIEPEARVRITKHFDPITLLPFFGVEEFHHSQVEPSAYISAISRAAYDTYVPRKFFLIKGCCS